MILNNVVNGVSPCNLMIDVHERLAAMQQYGCYTYRLFCMLVDEIIF